MKDYMFAPGRTAYDRGVRDLYRQRAETELIVTAQHTLNPARRVRIRTVGDMMLTLNFDSDIDRPLRKVFIGTHGNDSGWMQIQFDTVDVDGDGRIEANTTYEVLEEVALTNAFEFEDAAKNADTHVHIRGCMIGQDHAQPFLEKLKEVLGSAVPVAAPKHFHVVQTFPNAGFIEYFSYQFQISRLTRFTGSTARADLIQVFKDKAFDYIPSLGLKVNDDWWDKWIPRNVNLGKRTIRQRVNLDPPIQPRRGNPIVRINTRLPRSFRAVRQRYRYTVSDVSSNPGNQAARIQVAQDSMRAHDRFLAPPAQPFPEYIRYEFASIDAFFAGYNWHVTYNSSKNRLIATGTRYLYTCIVPVTSDPDPNDDTKNHLIFNFNPNNNNTNPAISLINEANADLFLIV